MKVQIIYYGGIDGNPTPTTEKVVGTHSSVEYAYSERDILQDRALREGYNLHLKRYGVRIV